MIFDTHAHYDDEQFDDDREVLLNSFKEAGIEKVVNACSDMDSIKRVLKLCEDYSFIYAAIGIHPSDSGDLTEDDLKWIEEKCKDSKVLAIGEIGLDYHYPDPKKEIQIKWFKYQIEMAKRVKLPVVIHSRDAAQDTLNILKEAKLPEGTVDIHCFSYSKEMAAEYVKLGYYLGIGGVVTFKNAKKLKEVVEATPIENILLETDCPYLAPEPNRGKRNSSLNLPYVVKAIAETKNMDEQEVIDKTWQNAMRFYNLEKN
ncbi:MAG: TatD family hydrolase [Butyrivibrio sp.]|nr:TatD family hydrolase [Butyrivibrio sp.]